MTTALTLLAASPSLAAGAGEGCPAYRASGPISVTRNGQVIHDLVITSGNGPAILVNGFSGVRIANVVIHHSGGAGIALVSAASTVITHADIIFDGAPPAGPNPSTEDNNIDCATSPGLIVNSVRVTRGSSGLYLDRCDGSRLTNIEGHDQRGPFPRGQLVQWDGVNGGSLSHFSDENSLSTSWTEDNVNIFQSANITITDGVVDTNNSPSGDGVIADNLSNHVLISNVDAIHQGNGCFAAYGGGESDITFSHTRCRDTYCTLPRGSPESGSLAWAIDPKAVKGNLNIESSAYTALCNPANLVWDASKLSILQLKRANFTPRAPIRVKLCQYGY